MTRKTKPVTEIRLKAQISVLLHLSEQIQWRRFYDKCPHLFPQIEEIIMFKVCKQMILKTNVFKVQSYELERWLSS